MARKKKHEEHVNHERWLVSYADFITLLFAFFVVMYAMSEVDAAKMKKASKSMRFALDTDEKGGHTKNWLAFFDSKSETPFGALDRVPRDGNPEIEIDEGGENTEQKDGIPSREATKNEKKKVSDKDKDAATVVLKRAVESAILVQGVRGSRTGAKVEYTTDGVRIRIPAAVLFVDGSTELRSDAWSSLADLSTALRSSGRFVRIDGHERSSAKSNNGEDWNLSLLRATRLVRFLISRGAVQARKISASGHGRAKPVAPNVMGTPNPNARYEILILDNPSSHG